MALYLSAPSASTTRELSDGQHDPPGLGGRRSVAYAQAPPATCRVLEGAEPIELWRLYIPRCRPLHLSPRWCVGRGHRRAANPWLGVWERNVGRTRSTRNGGFVLWATTSSCSHESADRSRDVTRLETTFERRRSAGSAVRTAAVLVRWRGLRGEPHREQRQTRAPFSAAPTCASTASG